MIFITLPEKLMHLMLEEFQVIAFKLFFIIMILVDA